MTNAILFTLGWVLCGVLANFLAGMASKDASEMYASTTDAPFLVVLGPVSLVIYLVIIGGQALGVAARVALGFQWLVEMPVKGGYRFKNRLLRRIKIDLDKDDLPY